LIPKIHIAKIETNLYEVHVEIAGQALWESEMYQSISDAIACTSSAIPANLGIHVEISYKGVSIGTISTARMQSEPEIITQELLSRYSAVKYDEDINASLVPS
jgi:hypothetical protein